MKLRITPEERASLLRWMAQDEDSEQLSNREWVTDLYGVEPPVSLDLVFQRESVFADGAEYLKYDPEQDGWYLSGPVGTADEVVQLLRRAGAFDA